MKEKTRNFYLKPSTEVFFVEYVQLMAGTFEGDAGEGGGGAGEDAGYGGDLGGNAKEFFGFGDDNDFESEKIFSAETSWDD